MNFKLSTKITIVFLLVAIISSLTVTFITIFNTNSLFSAYVEQKLEIRAEQWQNIFTSYYLKNKSWKGIEEVFPFYSNDLDGDNRQGKGKGFRNKGSSNGQGMGRNSDIIVLTDDSYKIIVASYNFTSDSYIPENLRERGLPLKVKEEVVGYFFINPLSYNGISELEKEFTVSLIKSSILAGIIIAIAAALVGIFFGRNLTTPLQKLTVATKRIALGDWKSRVKVVGSSETAQLASSFNIMAEKLEKTDNARRSLVADVAHELRNPLAIMRGQLEFILDGKAELKTEHILSLNDEVLRLTKIVDDLQELTLAEAGQLQLNKETFSLQEIFSKYEDFLSPLLEEKNINYIVEAKNVKDVYGDKRRIQQVFFNILTNALRYVPEGGKIKVSALENNQQVIVEVYNDGLQIQEEEIPYIFERFYKGDKSRSRQQDGTGLGLAIAKGFIEAHGGSISVQNVSGGVVFSFSIPKKSIDT